MKAGVGQRWRSPEHEGILPAGGLWTPAATLSEYLQPDSLLYQILDSSYLQPIPYNLSLSLYINICAHMYVCVYIYMSVCVRVCKKRDKKKIAFIVRGEVRADGLKDLKLWLVPS